MKSASPTVPAKPDDWPFEVQDVDVVLAKIEQRAKRRKTVRRRITCGASGAVVALLFGLWAVPFVRDTSTVATVAAHRQNLALADGSQAELNAQTSVRTDFRYGRRIVRLEHGEAFFSVAKDTAHPFLVETSAGTVRVTGTKFNVRLKEGGAAEVTLLEGSVTIEHQDAELGRLSPGDQLTTGSPAVHRLGDTEMEGVLSWREGRLTLDGRTLADATERLAAYHGKRITVAPDIAALRTGGSVSMDDLGAALSALEATLPVQVLPVDGGNFRLVRR